MISELHRLIEMHRSAVQASDEASEAQNVTEAALFANMESKALQKDTEASGAFRDAVIAADSASLALFAYRPRSPDEEAEKRDYLLPVVQIMIDHREHEQLELAVVAMLTGRAAKADVLMARAWAA